MPSPPGSEQETATLAASAPPRRRRTLLLVLAVGILAGFGGAFLALRLRTPAASPSAPAVAPTPAAWLRLVFGPETDDPATLDRVVEVLKRRAELLGIRNAEITRGTGREVVVRLPAGRYPDDTKRVLLMQGRLSLRLVEDEAPTREALLASGRGKVPDGQEAYPGKAFSGAPAFFLVRREAVVTDADVRHASAALDEMNQPCVRFRLSPEGAVRLGQVTEAHIGKRLAILIDGTVSSAPMIQSRIGDEGQITGLSPDDVAPLVKVLGSGSLPVPLQFLEESIVYASPSPAGR